jgi:uncharacterized protein
MDMTGERRIPAPRQKVWNALNDPQVLRACIPGCESLERTGPNAYTATAAVRIGPMAARFNGKVNLLDLDEPNGYRIQGEGQGSIGFANGGATVRLTDDGPYTLLSYAAQAQVGGKMAQLGARLIDSTSKQMADQFFDRFTAEVSGPAEVAAEGAAGVTATTTGDTPMIAQPSQGAALAPARQPTLHLLDLIPAEPFGLPWVAWIGCALYVVVFILLFSGYVLG